MVMVGLQISTITNLDSWTAPRVTFKTHAKNSLGCRFHGFYHLATAAAQSKHREYARIPSKPQIRSNTKLT